MIMRKRKRPIGSIHLEDRTPPVLAVHTKDGKIICSKADCQHKGEPQEKDRYPMQKGIPGSTCKDCCNKRALELKRARKNDGIF